MRYKLECLFCKATCWADGEDDPDTNATEIDDNQKLEWEPPHAACEHEEWAIIDHEYPDPLDD